MRARDYAAWIWSESRSSITFTTLNISGILINTCVLVVFLSLAFGVEDATIDNITEEVDNWTLTIQASNSRRLTFNDVAFLGNDSRVSIIIPQIDEFVDLRPGSDQPPSADDRSVVSAYMSNFYTRMNTGIDPRTQNFEFIRGRNLSAADNESPFIIVSERVFSDLAAMTTGLTLDNFNQVPVDLVVYSITNRTQRNYSNWPVTIVGIARNTSFNDRQIFGTWLLVHLVDNTVGQTQITAEPLGYPYEKMLVIANNIDGLQSLRSAVEERGFDTQSVFDRIENVRSFVSIVRGMFLVIFSAAIVIAAFNLIITLISYVMKRRKDIGILKSIGATDGQVQTIFVLHALYLSVIGAVLGVGASFLVMRVLQLILTELDSNLSDSIFQINIGYVILVVIFGLLLSTLSAFVPARRAAVISPIETLREQ